MGDGSAGKTRRLVLFAAAISVGTAILIVGIFSTVFLPGSVIPTVLIASGAILLGAGFVILFADAWRQRAAWIGTSFPAGYPGQIIQALDQLRSHSRSEVADATMSGTLIVVFIIGFLGTGLFGFSSSAIGVSPVELWTDVAVSLLSLAVGVLWAWVAPISRLLGPPRLRTAEAESGEQESGESESGEAESGEAESGLTTGVALVGPLGVGGSAPSLRPFWLLLSREAVGLEGSVIVLTVGGAFAYVAYQLGSPTEIAAMFVLGVALLVVAVVVAHRIRTLRRLCATGVEVGAELEDISATGSGDGRMYVARYRYMLAGRPFPLRIGGTFRRWAARFGERPIVLVDPEHPEVAVILKRP